MPPCRGPQCGGQQRRVRRLNIIFFLPLLLTGGFLTKQDQLLLYGRPAGIPGMKDPTANSNWPSGSPTPSNYSTSTTTPNATAIPTSSGDANTTIMPR